MNPDLSAVNPDFSVRKAPAPNSLDLLHGGGAHTQTSSLRIHWFWFGSVWSVPDWCQHCQLSCAGAILGVPGFLPNRTRVMVAGSLSGNPRGRMPLTNLYWDDWNHQPKRSASQWDQNSALCTGTAKSWIKLFAIRDLHPSKKLRWEVLAIGFEASTSIVLFEFACGFQTDLWSGRLWLHPCVGRTAMGLFPSTESQHGKPTQLVEKRLEPAVSTRYPGTVPVAGGQQLCQGVMWLWQEMNYGHMSKDQKMVCRDVVFGRRRFQKCVISCVRR